MRDTELQGNIAVNQYAEVAEGYSVYDSTREYLKAWAKANAEENAEIADQITERVAKVCKVKVCKNGNLFVGTYDEQLTKYVNFFLTPAEVIATCPKGMVQPEYTTTPQGRRVQTGWNWCDDEVLTDKMKDLQVVYVANKILEVF